MLRHGHGGLLVLVVGRRSRHARRHGKTGASVVLHRGRRHRLLLLMVVMEQRRIARSSIGSGAVEARVP